MAIGNLQFSQGLEITSGVDLLDNSNTFIEEFGNNFQPKGSNVRRTTRMLIQGTAKINVSKAINWNNQRFRPYITLTDMFTGETQKWNLGVYLPDVPKRTAFQSPQIYAVQCYDVLTVVNVPHGVSYTVDTGDNYLDTVATLLDSVGEPYAINQASASATLPKPMTWPLDQQNTTLKIINDLLHAIGYVNLYSDRDGKLTTEHYGSPHHSAIAATYSSSTSALSFLREKVDLFEIPNKWIFIRDHPDLTTPVEGTGIYTVTNQSDGLASIDSRGRTITKVQRFTVDSQASLVVNGDWQVTLDKYPLAKIVMSSSPNPDHWQSDIVTLDIPELGITTAGRYRQLSWLIPLDGALMQHEYELGVL